jgi:sialic acid synthase SpsE
MITTIDNVAIGAGFPCRFVAELSNNHNGDCAQAVDLLDAAKAAGADFAKVQCYTPDELVALRGDGPAPEPWGSQGWTMHALYEHAMTPRDFFEVLFLHADRIQLPLFASVFGEESLQLMEDLDCPAYKMARLDNRSTTLYNALKRTGKPVIVSGSGDDTNKASVLFADLRLYCPPGYPQAADVAWPKTFTGAPWDGISYHGTDPSVGCAAVAHGARLVEAHLQLSDRPSRLESAVSLTPHQFSAMVLNHA